ncbi:MAG: peptidylprolyl isomerase [Candidatus Margulisiibacteriota bacterium]
MKIDQDSVVYIAFELKNDAGEVIDKATTEDPLPFIFGKAQIIPGLENALLGKSKGDNLTVELSPEDAFGDYEEEYIQEANIEMFNELGEIKVGMDIEVEMSTDDGPMAALGRILSIEDDKVFIDLNHPLAGKKLNYSVEVINVRELTPEEEDLGTIKDFVD